MNFQQLHFLAEDGSASYYGKRRAINEPAVLADNLSEWIGIRWNNSSGESKDLFVEKGTISLIEVDDQADALVILFYNSSIFPVPGNGAIFNSQAKLMFHLQVPALANPSFVYSGCQGQGFVLLEKQNSGGEEFIVLGIETNCFMGRGNWVENRRLDVRTGQFKESVGTWVF